MKHRRFNTESLMTNPFLAILGGTALAIAVPFLGVILPIIILEGM